MRGILKDLWRKKIFVIICLLICAGIGTITGYKKSNFYDRISIKDKAKIDAYYEKLNKYEQDAKDTEESINLLNKKIKELQNYIDNSIFMHLNPDKIYAANVQFSTTFQISKADFLKDKYWNEVISVSDKGGAYTISIMQSTEEQALKVANIIVEDIKSKYKISPPEIVYYIKADVSIVDKQKKNLNNLSDYIKKRTELENSLKKQLMLVSTYKSEEKPKVLSEKDLRPISVIFRYTIFGFVTGIIGLVSIFTIRRIV